jgi:uncharacterized protein YqeY
MNLKTRFDQDLTTAMKSKDALKTSVLRMIKSAIRLKEVETTGAPLDDQQVMPVLGSMIKQRKDSIEKFQSGHRQDLAEKEQEEIRIIEQYLPQALSRDEIAVQVQLAIEETGASSPKDFGRVMKVAMSRFKGQVVDGKLISELVRERLG